MNREQLNTDLLINLITTVNLGNTIALAAANLPTNLNSPLTEAVAASGATNKNLIRASRILDEKENSCE